MAEVKNGTLNLLECSHEELVMWRGIFFEASQDMSRPDRANSWKNYVAICNLMSKRAVAFTYVFDNQIQ